MRKVLALMLVVSIGLVIAGCGKKPENRLLGLWRIDTEQDKVCRNLGLSKVATTLEFNKDGIVYADGIKMEYSIREGAYPGPTKEECKKKNGIQGKT